MCWCSGGVERLEKDVASDICSLVCSLQRRSVEVCRRVCRETARLVLAQQQKKHSGVRLSGSETVVSACG